MRSILIPTFLVALGMGVVAHDRSAQAQAQCPEGQVRTAEGACTAGQPGTGMPATEHQQEVLKEPKEGAATPSTGGGNMPATRHQQETIQPKQGAPQQ